MKTDDFKDWKKTVKGKDEKEDDVVIKPLDEDDICLLKVLLRGALLYIRYTSIVLTKRE